MLSVVQLGGRGTSGLMTGNSKTPRLDNLESEAVGGTCRAPDRGRLS